MSQFDTKIDKYGSFFTPEMPGYNDNNEKLPRKSGHNYLFV